MVRGLVEAHGEAGSELMGRDFVYIGAVRKGSSYVFFDESFNSADTEPFAGEGSEGGKIPGFLQIEFRLLSIEIIHKVI